LVRAIDSNVVNLITLAQQLGDAGTNNTGGGVITFIPTQAIGPNSLVYVQVQLGPPAAVLAGAGWQLQGDSGYGSLPTYMRAIANNGAKIEFKAIPGWNLPTNQTVALETGQITTISALYTVTNPVLVANREMGILLGGTTGTVYRIESSSSLTRGTWVPVSTNTIPASGLSPVLPLPPAKEPASFYRAVWLLE
jgi:hypothetical protein